MKEICIAFDNNLFVNVKKLCGNLKKQGYIVATIKEQDVSRVVIATTVDNFDNLTYYLKCFLLGTVLIKHKKRIIKNNLQLDDSLKSKILFLSLVNYDYFEDRTYFLSKLDFSSDLYISSLINFKMQLLIKKWIDICNLTKENLQILDTDSIYFSLIRYIRENGKTADITFSADIVKNNLINFNGKNFRPKDFLCYCATICPKEIKINANGKRFNYKDLFSKLFDNKLILI